MRSLVRLMSRRLIILLDMAVVIIVVEAVTAITAQEDRTLLTDVHTFERIDGRSIQ